MFSLQSLYEIDYIVQDSMFVESILNVEFRDSSLKGMFINGTLSSVLLDLYRTYFSPIRLNHEFAILKRQ